MKWHLTVPKIFHTYWGGDVLSYMRYMTIVSFMRQNPDWRVILWLPAEESIKRTWGSRELNYDVLCDDYLPKLMELPIEKIRVDFRDYGYANTISEVHKSDFLRMHLLGTMGGLWSDMDVLYFKPMTALGVNKPENANKETYVCISHYGHSAGFLMALPGSRYYIELAGLSLENFHPEDYQTIGATMFNKYFPKIRTIEKVSSVVNIGMDAVYAHDAMHISDIIDGHPPRFTDESIGIHWYAGHPLWGKFIKDTNGGLSCTPTSIIGTVLNNLNNGL